MESKSNDRIQTIFMWLLGALLILTCFTFGLYRLTTICTCSGGKSDYLPKEGRRSMVWNSLFNIEQSESMVDHSSTSTDSSREEDFTREGVGYTIHNDEMGVEVVVVESLEGESE